MLGTLKRVSGGLGGVLLQAKGFREICRVKGQIQTQQQHLLRRAGLCEMLRVTHPFPRILSSLGAGLASSSRDPPFQGLQR